MDNLTASTKDEKATARDCNKQPILSTYHICNQRGGVRTNLCLLRPLLPPGEVAISNDSAAMATLARVSTVISLPVMFRLLIIRCLHCSRVLRLCQSVVITLYHLILSFKLTKR